MKNTLFVCLFGATRSGTQELLLVVLEGLYGVLGIKQLCPGDQTVVHGEEAHYATASVLDGKH